MFLSGAEYLRHILEEVEYLVEHSRGVASEEFLRDETLRRAFVRSLEIIGEAAKKVPPELAEQLRDIEWRAMAGMERPPHPQLLRHRLRPGLGRRGQQSPPWGPGSARFSPRESSQRPSRSARMADLGLPPRNGHHGPIGRLCEQMHRVFSATIAFTWDKREQGEWHEAGFRVAKETHLWWSPARPEQVVSWRSSRCAAACSSGRR